MLSAQTLSWGLLLPAVVRATSYGLVKEYSGSTFFDDWDFYGNCTPVLSPSFIVFLPCPCAVQDMADDLNCPPSITVIVTTMNRMLIITSLLVHRAVDNLTNGDAMSVYIPICPPLAALRLTCGLTASSLLTMQVVSPSSMTPATLL